MNEHIGEYCKDYVRSSDKPNFALLVKGSWGCGKTFLVEKVLRDLIAEKDIDPKEIIQISLYGISSVQDLNERMFQVLHPFWSSPQVQFAGMLLRSALKFGTTIDVNNDGKGDASISFGGIEKKKKVHVKDIKKRLIVIDDLERCDLEPTVIFGFFSEMILRFGLKAIFIGNEDEIRGTNEEKNGKFLRIKEKLVGVEFSVSANRTDAIEYFLHELNIETDKEMLATSCLLVVNTLDYDNLRNIRQCFFNLKVLLRILPREASKEYINGIVVIFVALFLQKCQNAISQDQVNDAVLAFVKHEMSFKNYSEKVAANKNFGFTFNYPSVPLATCWSGIIFDGNFSNDTILEAYALDHVKPADMEQSTLFQILETWREMEPKLFKSKVEQLFLELRNGVYLHPGELMHFTNITCFFSGWGLIPNQRPDIQKLVLDTIETFADRIESVKDWGMLRMSYGGFGFSDDCPEVVPVRNRLIEIAKINKKSEVSVEISILVENLSSQVGPFVQSLLHVNGNGNYYKEPIMSMIDISKLFEKLKELPARDLDMVIHGLEERYGKIYGNQPFSPEYLPDIENVTRLRDLFGNTLTDKLYNPMSLHRESISKRLTELVEYMESFRGKFLTFQTPNI